MIVARLKSIVPASRLVTAFVLAITLALVSLLAIAWRNFRDFPRLRRRSPTALPTVSVLVAARNEEARIGATVAALLAQDYPGPYELIVLDDCSTDGTSRAARTAGGDHPAFRMMQGNALPEGWAGKPWACHQLAQEARGEVLVFTDADVHWEPSALKAVLAEHEATAAGLLSIWPTQHMGSRAERLVVPLMSFALLAYLPIRLAQNRPEASAAAANGQCMVFRREVYEACGGHAAVRASVLEDVKLARRVKASGHRLRLADASGLIHARMYCGWKEVRDGFAKNILAGHLDSVILLLLSAAAHLALFVLPWLWLLTGFRVSRLVALPLVLAGVLARAFTAATARQPRRDALLMPLSVLLMTRIAAHAIWWKWRYGGPLWKGRRLP